MEQDIIVFADDRALELKIHCPLCKRVYTEPYITTCGHTFCFQCINSTSTTANSVCPIDSIQFSPVVRNIAVFEQVGELLVHCRYGCKLKANSTTEYEVDNEGCPDVIKIAEKKDHETNCQYCPVQCPHNAECPVMLRKDLQDHLSICQFIHCPHHKYGCQYRGDQDAIDSHLKECKYEGVKDYLWSLDKMTSNLKEEMSGKNKIIEDLNLLVSNLKEKLEQTEKQTNKMSLRLEHLEEQYENVMKEITQTHDDFDVVKSKLSIVEQQLGLNVLQPQHLFKCHGTFVGHKGPVWSVCIAGDLLFSASSDNTIKVWNLSATYAGPRTMTGHDGIVLAVCHCAKNNYLYSGSSDKTIKVWNIKTLALETSFIAHDDPICTLASSDERLYSGSLKSIKVWDLSNNNKLLKVLPTQNHWVRALVATEQCLYSGSYRSVKIWNIETMEVAHVLQCNGGSVYSLAVTDRHIVCGTYENMIHIWDVQTLAEIASLSGHVGSVYSLAVLPAPGGQNRLFSASYDKTIRVWNMDLMTCAQTMSRHEGSVTCLTINRGRIISGSVDSTIKIWH